MPTRTYQTTIAAPLAQVWQLYDDPARGLPALSPPGAQVKLESADLPVRAGSRVVVIARGPLGRRLRWVAKIIEHRPPHAVVFGEEARFVDEQESGPLAYWRHEHEFEAVDSRSTRLIDRVTYRLPYGPLGMLADLLVARWQIDAMFRHRHRVTKALLER